MAEQKKVISKGRADVVRRRDGKKAVRKSGRLFLKVKYDCGDT